MTKLSAIAIASLGVLLLGGPAGAVSVYVQDPVGNRIVDPALASVSGAGFEAMSNLSLGDFGVAVSASTAGASSVLAGTFSPIVFTNTGTGPLTIGSGHIMAHVSPDVAGAYDLSLGDPTGAVATQVFATLSARVGGVFYIAEGSHGLRIDGLGATSTFTPRTENGGIVSVAAAGFGGLDMSLALPDITLAPHQTLELAFLISAANQVVAPLTGLGIASADFCCSAQLSMLLPADALLANDAAQPLLWVTQQAPPSRVPEPASLLMLAAGLLVSFGARRRS